MGRICRSPRRHDAALDRFFDGLLPRRPVTATFTGVHEYDHACQTGRPTGYAEAVAEMQRCRERSDAAGRVADDAVRAFPDEVDLALADAFLEIQIAEHEGGHFYRGNPSLWSGEAIFAVYRPGHPRLRAAARPPGGRDRTHGRDPRLSADAPRTMMAAPAAWRDKALRECEAAETAFRHSLPAWFAALRAAGSRGGDSDACDAARRLSQAFEHWVAA